MELFESKRTKLCKDPDCERRGIRLPLDEFYKAHSTKDGHANKCKECARRISGARYTPKDRKGYL